MSVPNPFSRLAIAAFCAIQLGMKQRMYTQRDLADMESIHGSIKNSLKQNDYRFYASTVSGYGCCCASLVHSSPIFTASLCGVLASLVIQNHYLTQKDKIIDSQPQDTQFMDTNIQ